MTIAENFSSNLSNLDIQVKKIQKALDHWDLIHQQLRRLERDGFVTDFSVQAMDVVVFYKATYLDNNPDNGWDRKTSERFAMIVEVLGFFGYEHNADIIKPSDAYPGHELTVFDMSA